jgi:histidyl-tRNA synthetase
LAEKSEALIGVMVGENEMASNTVAIKPLGKGEHSKGDVVSREKMVEWIRELLTKLNT